MLQKHYHTDSLVVAQADVSVDAVKPDLPQPELEQQAIRFLGGGCKLILQPEMHSGQVLQCLNKIMLILRVRNESESIHLLAATSHQLHLHDKQPQGKSYIMCGYKSSM